MKNYKKKVIFSASLIVTILILFPSLPAQFIKSVNIPQTNLNNDEFTHTILGEYCTTTTCPYCPEASAQMYQVYNSGYNFSYVSLVSNKNSFAAGRVSELGFTSVPSVAFDGGYIKIKGRQNNHVPYQDAVITSGDRTVVDTDLDLDAFWMGEEKIQINIYITNNQASTYTGHLHVYITEKTSRWKDYDGDPYHFAMIGNYAFNNNVNVDAGETDIIIRTWKSPYSDITKDNIRCIASVFASSSKYNDETVATDPELPNNDPPSIPNRPTGPNSGYIGIPYTFSTSSIEPNGDLIQYGWDWDNDEAVEDWTDFYPSDQTTNITYSWDSIGKYNIKVKAKDQFGIESEWSDQLELKMPKYKINNFLSIILEKFFYCLPIFEKLLKQTI